VVAGPHGRGSSGPAAHRGGGHGGSTAEQGGVEGARTHRGRAWLGFIGGRPLLRDVPARQGADRGSSAVRRRGQHQPCACTGAQHAASADSRGVGVRACLGKVLSLGRRAGRLGRRGWRALRSTARARGRARCPGRRDVAARRQTNSTGTIRKGKTPKIANKLL
jgi:hypothetical protein